MSGELTPFAGLNPSMFSGRAIQLSDFLTARQKRLLDQSDEARAELSSTEQVKEYARRMRETFLEKLGGIPARDCPLDAKTTKVLRQDGYTLESIVYKARRGVYVTASLYLPDDLPTPAPAVLYLSGHTAEGRMSRRYQEVCQILAHAGLIVFAPDPVGQGERKSFYDPKTGEYALTSPVPDHDRCGVPSLCTGRFLGAYFVSDLRAAVDCMLTRPEIDPARIGVTGCSGGGLQSLYMMVCDDRIAAAAPAAFTTTRRDILGTCQSQDSEQIWPGCAAYGFDHFEPYIIFAPKPVMLLTVSSDFFPVEGAYAVYDRLRPIYALYGKEENISIYEDDACHGYTLPLAEQTADFFCRVFGVNRRTGRELKPLPVPEIQATRTGNVKGDFADAVTIPDETDALAAELRSRRAGTSPREWLLAQTERDRIPAKPWLRMADAPNTVHANGYAGRAMMWWVQKDLAAFGVMIEKDAPTTNKNAPVVIALWDNGTRAIPAYEDRIRDLCAAGSRVLVVDLPGVGSLEQAKLWGWASYREAYGTMYKMCCDLMYMDDSMAAMQTYHLLRTVGMLRESLGAERISFYCAEQEGVYGIMAGYLTGLPREYAPDLLTDVQKQYLPQRPLTYDNTLSYIIPGMLRHFDYGELMQ